MPQRFEGHFQTPDETDLFFQVWSPEKKRGTFLITHGLSEHSECYHPLARELCDDGWQVIGWDMRGHGRSEGKRGYVKNLGVYVDDLQAFYDFLKREGQLGSESLLFFGHSMGGLVTIRFLETHQPAYSALSLSSPLLGLSVAVPKYKETLANIAVNWLPTLTMYNEIRYSDLTRDEEMIHSYERDNLRHDKISPGLFLSMVESFPLALEDAGSIDKPVLLQAAGEDRVVSTPAARAFFERLPGKKNQLLVYPGCLHEIFNDLDREKVIADLKKFINPYLGG